MGKELVLLPENKHLNGIWWMKRWGCKVRGLPHGLIVFLNFPDISVQLHSGRQCSDSPEPAGTAVLQVQVQGKQKSQLAQKSHFHSDKKYVVSDFFSARWQGQPRPQVPLQLFVSIWVRVVTSSEDHLQRPRVQKQNLTHFTASHKEEGLVFLFLKSILCH